MAQALETVIDRIYDAGLGSDSWAYVVADICRQCGAESGVLVINDQRTGELRFSDENGLAEDYRRLYVEDLRDDDLRLSDLLRHPVGTLRTDTMIDDYDAYRNSRAYRELYAKLGTEHALGAFLYDDGARVFGLRLFRPHHVGPFADDEIRCYERLMPHLSRAFRLAATTKAGDGRLARIEWVLDLMPQGLLIAAESGAVLACNRAARKIVGPINAAGTALTRRIAAAAFDHWRTTGARSYLSMLERTGDAGLQIRAELMAPQGEWGEDPAPLAAVMLVPADATPAPSIPALQALYGLTEAEARVLERLVAGDTLDICARSLGVSRETVRSHLRAIFAKTGVGRQADLIRLVLSGPAILERIDRLIAACGPAPMPTANRA